MSGWGGARPGSGCPRKLSDWEADELRSMRRRGEALAALASNYGISERTALRYLREYEKERS